MITVLAVYLGNREGRLDSLGSVLGACLLMGPAVILVMAQPDLGSSLVLVAILAGMLFMSGASLRWLIAMAVGLGDRGAPVRWTYILRDYQKDRILSFFNQSADTQGSGWQVQPVADHGRVGRAARHRPHQRDAVTGRVPAGPGERLRVRGPGRRSWASSGPSSSSCCSPR